jgi:hypothetical protein
LDFGSKQVHQAGRQFTEIFDKKFCDFFFAFLLIKAFSLNLAGNLVGDESEWIFQAKQEVSNQRRFRSNFKEFFQMFCQLMTQKGPLPKMFQNQFELATTTAQ